MALLEPFAIKLRDRHHLGEVLFAYFLTGQIHALAFSRVRIRLTAQKPVGTIAFWWDASQVMLVEVISKVGKITNLGVKSGIPS